MDIVMEPLKCSGCGACELACSFYRDEVFSTMRSSTMIHREEKKNYFGVMLKRDDDLVLGRPEGVEIMGPGESSGDAASSKPILLREPCDVCEGDPLCVKFCPTGSLKAGGE